MKRILALYLALGCLVLWGCAPLKSDPQPSAAPSPTPQASAAKSYPGAAQDAMTQIPAGYDRYICIAKSFGTMVAAGWVKAHPEYHVTLLQLTPLAWEYAPLYAGMPAWHATGTADPLGGAALRRALEDDPAITTYFVEGGNHSLDTPEDYTIGLEALKDIVRKYEEAMR